MTIYQRLRNQGHDVISPPYTRTFFAVLNGAVTVRQVAEATGLAETTASGHLKRLKGWGLIDWGVTRAGNIKPTVGLVPLAGGDNGAHDVEPKHRSEPRITNVRELRKGDVLTLDGKDYPVKEVRIGKKAERAAIRLGIPDGEWWHKTALDVPIEARRTHEAQKRINQATVPRDGMYRYGR